jgi:hypothetical protein
MCVKGKASVPVTLEVMKYKTCQIADSHGVFFTSSKPAWVLPYIWHVKEACFARSQCLATFLLALMHNKLLRK